jgi:hypothetical protein
MPAPSCLQIVHSLANTLVDLSSAAADCGHLIQKLILDYCRMDLNIVLIGSSPLGNNRGNVLHQHRRPCHPPQLRA